MDNRSVSVVYQNFTIHIGEFPEDMVELVESDLCNKNRYNDDFMYVRIT